MPLFSCWDYQTALTRRDAISAALGIDPHTEVTKADGRLAFLSDGNAINEVFA